MTEIEKEMQKIQRWLFPSIKIKWARRLIEKVWYRIFKDKINGLIENELAKINIKDFNELLTVKDIPITEKPMFVIRKKEKINEN